MTGKSSVTSNRPKITASVDSIIAEQLEEFRRLAALMEERGQTDSYYHARVRELEGLTAPDNINEVQNDKLEK